MKSSTLALGLVVTALSACGGASLGTSGAAGTSGGTVGTGEGATGGSAGAGGTNFLPACSGGSAVSASVAISGADGMLVAEWVSDAVRVTSVITCPSDQCTGPPGTTRILLSGDDPGERELILTNVAMPSDFIKVGDRFDLTIDAAVDESLYRTVDQTVVLSREGNVILFGAKLQRFGRLLPLPNLLPWGITFSDGGPTCTSASPTCAQTSHALRVSVATDASILLSAGQTGTTGGLSVTNGGSTELFGNGNCDAKSTTQIAGFQSTGAGGSAGASGTGGTGGGSGGRGGSAGSIGPVGGTGGTNPACGGAGGTRDYVEVAMVGSDGKLLTSDVQAAVTVASIDSCTTVTCPSFPVIDRGFIVSTAATRIGLTGPDPQRWMLYLRNGNMPADFIKVGDRYDLTVDAHVAESPPPAGYATQTVVLARGTDLALFASNTTGLNVLGGAAALSAFGIGVALGDTTCTTPETAQDRCRYSDRDMVATVAGESASVSNGRSGRVGWLSFTNGGVTQLSGSFCDTSSFAALAGYRVP